MRYGADLNRLTFTVKKRAAQPVVAFVANGGAGIPELLRIGLVSDIFQHAGDLPILYLVEQLTAELEIIPLLIDRIRAVADDIDAFLDIFDQVVWRQRRLSGP